VSDAAQQHDDFSDLDEKPFMGKPPPKPTALPVHFDVIPLQLRTKNRWLVWKYTWKKSAEKWDKPPRSAKTGKVVDGTKPASWCSFAEARAAYKKGGLDGIGFAADSPFLDLDKVVGPDGEIHPKALEIVRTLNSYTEITPSKTGLRIPLLGNIPEEFLGASSEGKRQKGRKNPNFFGSKCAFEVYEGEHYLTITGHHLEGTPSAVEERPAELRQIMREVFGVPVAGKPATQAPPRYTTIHDVTDEQIIERASKAENCSKFLALWAGDAGSHPSPSEADAALCGLLVNHRPALDAAAARLPKRTPRCAACWPSGAADPTRSASNASSTSPAGPRGSGWSAPITASEPSPSSSRTARSFLTGQGSS
jgi:primase-polymerase (primpol)-like protein